VICAKMEVESHKNRRNTPDIVLVFNMGYYNYRSRR
jgi:hypothetical protein